VSLLFSVSSSAVRQMSLYAFIGAGLSQWYSVGLRVGWSGARVLVRARNLSPHHRVQTGSGSLPPTLQYKGYQGLFPWGKAAGAWSWPPPSSAEVKNAWRYKSTPPIKPSWSGAQLKMKHRNYFTFNIRRITSVSACSMVLFWIQIGVRFPARAGNFSLRQSWAHPASSPVGTGVFFLWG
jgi:hypothetical protein